MFPIFVFDDTVPAGYYQCVAFDENLDAYTDVGPNPDEAAYGALYDCGGDNYQAAGCYIPDNYCQLK